jgi:hypothetical protein
MYVDLRRSSSSIEETTPQDENVIDLRTLNLLPTQALGSAPNIALAERSANLPHTLSADKADQLQAALRNAKLVDAFNARYEGNDRTFLNKLLHFGALEGGSKASRLTARVAVSLAFALGAEKQDMKTLHEYCSGDHFHDGNRLIEQLGGGSDVHVICEDIRARSRAATQLRLHNAGVLDF